MSNPNKEQQYIFGTDESNPKASLYKDVFRGMQYPDAEALLKGHRPIALPNFKLDNDSSQYLYGPAHIPAHTWEIFAKLDNVPFEDNGTNSDSVSWLSSMPSFGNVINGNSFNGWGPGTYSIGIKNDYFIVQKGNETPIIKKAASEFPGGYLPDRVIVGLQGGGGSGCGNCGGWVVYLLPVPCTYPLQGLDGASGGSGAFACGVLNIKYYEYEVEVAAAKKPSSSKDWPIISVSPIPAFGGGSIWRHESQSSGYDTILSCRKRAGGSFKTIITAHGGGSANGWAMTNNIVNYITNNLLGLPAATIFTWKNGGAAGQLEISNDSLVREFNKPIEAANFKTIATADQGTTSLYDPENIAFWFLPSPEAGVYYSAKATGCAGSSQNPSNLGPADIQEISIYSDTTKESLNCSWTIGGKSYKRGSSDYHAHGGAPSYFHSGGNSGNGSSQAACQGYPRSESDANEYYGAGGGGARFRATKSLNGGWGGAGRFWIFF